MQQEDDLKALENIVQFARGLGVFFLVLHVYWYCYEWLSSCGLTYGYADRLLLDIQRTTLLFSSPVITKLCAFLFLALGCYGTKSVRNGRVDRWHLSWSFQYTPHIVFLILFTAVLSERLSAVAARWDRLPGLELHADPWCGLPQPAGRRRVAAAIDETAAYGRSFQ